MTAVREYPCSFSGASTAAILALTAFQTARGVDPVTAVEDATETWYQRLRGVGNDTFTARQIQALVMKVAGQPEGLSGACHGGRG
ncbi:hypothetical protein GCM10023339_46420 [Alloalcanivorax gelatiniphagus]